MRFAHALEASAESVDAAMFAGIQRHVPDDWVAQALEASGKATVRRRRMPAEQVVWMIVGMALFRNLSIEEVVTQLDLALDSPRGPLASSAIPQARQRVGSEPMKRLFENTARHWSHHSADAHRWRGLGVYAVDGSTLTVADTEENAKRFGYAQNIHGNSGYPVMRVVALMALHSHLLVAASFGPFRDSEMTHAYRLIDSIPDQSLTVFDRLFYGSELLLSIQGNGHERHWLVRLRSSTRYTELERLGPGDHLVEIHVSKDARRKAPTLPRTFKARLITYKVGKAKRMLLTSLLDAKSYPAADLIGHYQLRWEIELGYGEVKVRMLDRMETIRSKTSDGVEQEFWGILLAYNLVRLEIQRAAKKLNVSPLRISFTGALVSIRYTLMCLSLRAPGSIPKQLTLLESNLRRLVLPERRKKRSYPRAVKVRSSKFPRKKPAAA